MDFSLSVVIPNYNNEQYLQKCIQSVLDQTYEELSEVIVVDDCSTDRSQEIILQMAKNNPLVKPVFLKENGRVSLARNRGLAESSSKYITFLDGDDYYYNPNKLKNEMRLIREYHSYGQDVIAYSSIVRVSNDGKKVDTPQIHKLRYMQGNVYGRLLIGVGMNRIMRDYCVNTEIIRRVGGYNPQNSFFEDLELIFKIGKYLPFRFTNEYGTAYRDSINGLSKRSTEEQMTAVNRIIGAELATLPLFKRVFYKTTRAIHMLMRRIAKYLLGRG